MSDQPKTLFGHPLGLYVLFFTEMWERFSFYGMKTLLMLYMINHFFWSQEDASHLMGVYTFLCYALPVVGGIIADHWLGSKRSVLVGGILLSMGHIVMAIEVMWCFYTALALIIAGVGLLKPNVSTQVGSLYRPSDPRRDGAFTIFYMGINLGALFGPLLCAWLQVNYGYSYGFGAAGVGMILGLIVYSAGQRTLVEFNQEVGEEEEQGKAEKRKNATEKASAADLPKLSEVPHHVVRDRIIVLVVVFAFVIIFWTAFEQSYNAMLVWADKHTNLLLTSFDPSPVTLDTVTAAVDAEGESWFDEPGMTSGQTQSINPFFIITLAPLFAWFWIWLDRRKLQPSTPTKMVLGLAMVAVAFGIMWPAAQREAGPSEASLAALPCGFSVDEDGRLFTTDADSGDQVFYGATRLRYDADRKLLRMGGVLPDLDRLKILSETAPVDFKKAIEALVEKSADLKKTEELTEVLADAPAGFAIVGEEARKAAAWDSETKTLTVMQQIGPRAEVELLATTADPDLKAAVDEVYLASSEHRVTVWWLILFFMCLTMGELCLSPVGLSLVTKLAPPKHVGLFMGGWFLATAVAEFAANMFGAYWGKMTPMSYFTIFVVMCGIGALFMAVLIRPMKRMMHGVH